MTTAQNRLVYTTDPKQMHNNMQVYDESIAKEAKREAQETISNIRKSIKRKIPMAKVTEKNRNKYLSEVTKIIKTLANAPRTFDELYDTLYDVKSTQNVKRLQNLLQTIRCGSESIVFTKDKLWQIHRNYLSGEEKLISKVMGNLGARFKKKDKDSSDKKMDKTPIKKKEKSVPGNDVVNNSTKIFISSDREAITVPVKIALTIQVKIEVIQ